jgi:hypothetical protein
VRHEASRSRGPCCLCLMGGTRSGRCRDRPSTVASGTRSGVARLRRANTSRCGRPSVRCGASSVTLAGANSSTSTGTRCGTSPHFLLRRARLPPRPRRDQLGHTDPNLVIRRHGKPFQGRSIGLSGLPMARESSRSGPSPAMLMRVVAVLATVPPVNERTYVRSVRKALSRRHRRRQMTWPTTAQSSGQKRRGTR